MLCISSCILNYCLMSYHFHLKGSLQHFFFLNFIYLFLAALSLHCSELGLLSSCGTHCCVFSCCRAQVQGALASAVTACGSIVAAPRLQNTGSIAVAHRLNCSTSCRIFPDQGSNPCLLNWQADSLPLSLQGSRLQNFLQGDSASGEFSQSLFIWECLNFSDNFQRVFCHKQILADSSFLSALSMCPLTAFWPPQFTVRNQLLILLRIPLFIISHFPLPLLKFLFVS